MRTTTKEGAATLLAGLLAVGLVAGCSWEGEQSAGDKAGGSGSEVSLRVGTADSAELPTAKAIEEFARQAEAVSDGKIRIEVSAAAGESPDDPDQQVARVVSEGTLDGGMIPARAWDTEGVTTLRPLTAPFLLTSDDAVARVVTGELAGELLSRSAACGSLVPGSPRVRRAAACSQTDGAAPPE